MAEACTKEKEALWWQRTR